ncbi:hypothetical protein [Foetidibacter luteolus]|uniref:hypothetical protein n=1 Tax=Foetidibacter luteolus TaxID=2608880 RepID=UPI00129B5F92|nr:hypothetical protein [Foetidibacter luteolus]
MITTTIRNLTQDETQRQIKRLPSVYKRFENFVLKLIVVVLVLLAPLLIYDRFNPVPSHTQAVYCIVIVILAVLIVFWVTKKFEGGLTNSKQIDNIKSGQVEVVKVQTTRAIKREDFEDFGVAFYLAVVDNGQPKTLFLWGQYLDELEYEKTFPNTEFEFIRKVGSDEFIDFKTSGQYFIEEKVLPAFDKEVWKTGRYPVNGQLLDQVIDDIV